MGNNNNNNIEDQIKCRIEQHKKYINELNDKLCDYDDVVLQRNEIKNQMSAALAELSLLKTKQTDTSNELIRRHDKLSSDYNTNKVKLIHLIEENEGLLNRNEELHEKLDQKETFLIELENLHSTLLRDSQNIQNKLKDATELTNKYQDKKQLMEIKFKITDQDLNCIQNELAEKIINLTQLEKNVSNEVAQSESLQSSIKELKIKYDKIDIFIKGEITECESKLNETFLKSAMIKQKLEATQDKIVTQKYQSTELKKGVKEYREFYFTQHNKVDKIIGKLTAEIKSFSSNLESINIKLCDAQIENSKLKCQLKGQWKAIKLLESKKKQLEEKTRNIKKTEELMINKIETNREQHYKEMKALEQKFELNNNKGT